ncbi:MAG: diguanylate cyclase [Gammaproteobacteria bacterium]
MLDRYSLPMRAWLRMGTLALLSCVAAASGAALDLPASAFNSPPGTAWFGLFVDASATLDIEAVRARPDAFAPASRGSANLGFTRARVWAYFRLRHADGRRAPLFLLLPRPLLDQVSFYEVRDDAVRAHSSSGDALPFAARALPYRDIAFELPARPGATVDYFVRVDSPTSAVDMTLELVDEETFRRRVSRDQLLLGGYFGVMAGLVVTALMLALLLRQAVFASFALYVGTFALMSAAVSGYGMMLLWPDTPVLQQVLPTLLVTVAIFAGIAFLQRFIELSAWPVFRRLFRAGMALATLGATVHLLTDAQLGTVLVIATALALCPAVLVACLLRALRGDRFAGWFLCGWLAYSVGTLVAAVDMIGLADTGPWGAYALYLGALVKFVTLTLAMADRLRLAENEKEAQIAATHAELAALNHNLESMVRERTCELEERNRELGELAIRDSLTGLYNHSATIELLDQMLHQSHRYDFPVTVLMLDIDHFKHVNDTYGHQVGDAVLETVSRALLDALRDSDVVGRYGGEEFLIAMPHADALAARDFGERLLRRMRAIDIAGAPQFHLSASIGISVCHARDRRMGAAELIGRADEALYRSKREGRDRLTVDNLGLVGASGTSHPGGMPTAPL